MENAQPYFNLTFKPIFMNGIFHEFHEPHMHR